VDAVIELVALMAAVVVYHELAHMVAAKRYGVYEATVLFRHRHWLWQFVCFGAAVGYEDSVSRRTEWAIALAPLVYAPLAALLWLVGTWGYAVGTTLSLVAGGAAAMVLASDVPMLVRGENTDEDWRMIVLDGELQ
jgi:Zn-dependent protease